MAPPSLWSGNLRLSLVLIPVRLVSAVSAEAAISFRQIHEPSGQPIKNVKGYETVTPSPRFQKKKSSRATSTPRGITF